jgi:hypothetical protein
MANTPVSKRRSIPDRTGFQPYNIWKQMEPRLRRRLALAVFLMFAAIGPLSVLMNETLHRVTPLYVALVTIGSGGISASIILFARRWYLLLPSVILCFSLIRNAVDLTSPAPVDSTETRHEAQQPGTVFGHDRPIDTPRMALGVLAIGLIAAGYVGFIIVLSTEGTRRARLETEVAIARQIQDSLLPSETLTIPWAESAGRTIPAADVGGDFFDIHLLPDGRLLLFLADVAGHGVGAGILAAMTKSAVYVQASVDPSPGRVLAALNRTLRDLSDRRMFVTAACVVLDGTSRRMQVATAGHPPILLRSSAGIAEIRTPSVGLGMKEDVVFDECEVPVGNGDVVLLYSDGLVERTDRKGEQYDLPRLRQALQNAPPRSVGPLLETILDDVTRFAGRRPQADDITVLAVRIV